LITRIFSALALCVSCAAIFVSSGTAASNTTCGASAGHMYACITVDYYTSTCGSNQTHYAFNDEYLQAVRGNSGWWASGASVAASSNGFTCSGVWQTSASKPVTISWYDCCDGVSGSLYLGWPPVYAGGALALWGAGAFQSHYGTASYGTARAKWCPFGC
jgi:hypothetical protein